jgi:hypothetical protein
MIFFAQRQTANKNYSTPEILCHMWARCVFSEIIFFSRKSVRISRKKKSDFFLSYVAAVRNLDLSFGVFFCHFYVYICLTILCLFTEID